LICFYYTKPIVNQSRENAELERRDAARSQRKRV